MTKKKTKTKFETWRYMGRILDGKALFYSYEAEDEGDLKVFKKLPATSPGALYEVEVERKKDGGITVHGSASYVIGQEIDSDPRRLEAQAHDRAVSIVLETRRAEKAGAYKELEDHFDALKSCYQRQTGVRRAAFLAHIIQRVTGR